MNKFVGPVDVDRIIRERDVALVEHHISTVVEYVLDKEQAEVLDTNFVKIFRMGQLAVEYLLFCKKYLDNTVVLLKKDMAKMREVLHQCCTLTNYPALSFLNHCRDCIVISIKLFSYVVRIFF